MVTLKHSFIVLLLSLNLWLGMGSLCPEAAAADLAPILELDLQDQPDALRIAALWTPFFNLARYHESSQAGLIQQQLKDMNQRLDAQTDTSKKAAVYEKQIDGYVNLLRFVSAEYSQKPTTRARSRAAISKYHQEIQRLSLWLAVSAKEPKQKAYGMLQSAIASYLESGQVKSNEALIAAKLRLPPELARQAEFLLSMSNIDSGQALTDSLKSLNNLLPRMNLPGKVLGTIYLARAQIAIGPRVTMPSSGAYFEALRTANKLASGLGNLERQEVLRSTVYRWREAVGPEAPWTPTPFVSEGFNGLSELRALQERSALDQAARGRFIVAAQQYHDLAIKRERNEERQPLDKRSLDLYSMDAVQSKNPAAYQAALAAAFETYQDPNVLGRGAQKLLRAMRVYLRQAYHDLAEQEYAMAALPGTSISVRQRAIQSLRGYVRTAQYGDERLLTDARIAKLLRLNRDYAGAFAAFLALAHDPRVSNLDQRLSYLHGAIEAQEQLSGWVGQSPFRLAQVPLTPPRQAQLSILSQLRQEELSLTSTSPTIDWEALAQAGVLDSILGEELRAHQNWLQALSKRQIAPLTAPTIGYWLRTLEQRLAWPLLEEASRAAIAAHVNAMHLERPVDISEALSKSLWQQGQAAYTEQQYAKARRAFKDFSELFLQHPQRDQALALLYLSQSAGGEHREALATLVSLSEQYPDSRTTLSLMSRGADYALDQGHEDLAQRFFEHYLKKLPNTPEALNMRLQAATIMLARGQSEAGVLQLSRCLETPGLSDEQAEVISRQLIAQAEDKADRASALAAALLGQRAAPESSSIKASVYQQRLRSLATQASREQLQAMATSIDSELDQSRGMRLVLAEARGQLVQVEASAIHTALSQSETTEVLAKMQRLQEQLQDLRQSVANTCSAARSHFCARAQYQLFKTSRALQTAYANAAPPLAPGSPEAIAWQTAQTTFAKSLNKLANAARKEVQAEIVSGFADAEWVRETYARDRDAQHVIWMKPLEAPLRLQIDAKPRQQLSNSPKTSEESFE